MAEKQAGGLSLRIGLTLSQLQSDFLAAEQTVKQGIAALNRQQNIVKLKMQTDLSGLDLAADRAKILEVQERSLTQLLEMQRDKLTLATRAYQEYANSKGVNAAGAKNLETAMEKERLAVARLEEQLKSLSSQKISLDTSRLQEKIAKINAKINNVKLKAEIDTSQLSGATAAFDSQKIHIAAVTRELELQRQKLIQLREALHSSIKNTGVGSVQSLNIKSNVLQQVQEINRLESKLKELRNTDIKLQIRADSLKQAESQINENIARLNARLENIRVKAEIDTSKLSASASEFDKAKVHVQGLTRELELQKQKLAELQKAMYTSAKINGVGNVKTINLSTDIQRQIQEINQLKAKIDELNKIQPPKTNSLLSGYLNIKGDITGKLTQLTTAFNGVTSAASSADGAIQKSLEIIGAIPHPVGKVIAALVSIPLVVKGIESSLLSMAKAGIASGDTFYVMSRGMQLSIADMAKLSTVAKVTGIEISEVNSVMRRLHMQLAKGGAKDGLLVQTLQNYGAEVRDETGRLKNHLDMAIEVSKALKNAQAQGNGAEFIDIVGGKFWSGDTVTFFEDLSDNLEQAKKVVKNGLSNPTWAHALQGELNTLNAQAGQLNGAFSAALMPVVAEIIPRAIERLGELTKVIEANKENIKFLGDAMAVPVRLLNELTDGVISLSAAIDKAKDKGNTFGKIFEALGQYRDDVAALMNVAPATALTSIFSPIPGETGLAIDFYRKEIDEFKKARAEAEEAAKVKNDQKQAQMENAQGLSGLPMDQQLKFDSLEEERIKREQETADIIYKINHTGYENSLRDLENFKAEQLRIIEEMEAQLSAAAGKDIKLEDERGALDDNIAAKELQIEQEKENRLAEIRERIASSDRTAFENRMADIEAEKQKWLEVGMSKAEAEKLSEQQKADYIRSVEEELANNITAIHQTELERRLSQIEREKQAWIDKGASVQQAEQFAQEKILQANQEKEEKLNAIRESVASLFRSDIENRIADIEREKEAWIKAGMEEAEAESLAAQKKQKALEDNVASEQDNLKKQAEAWKQYYKQLQAAQEEAERKNKALRDEALNTLKSEAEEFNAYMQGGYEGLQKLMYDQLIKSGVNPEYLKKMTPELLEAYKDAKEKAQQNFLPNWKDPYSAEAVQKGLKPLQDSAGNTAQSLNKTSQAAQNAAESLNQLASRPKGAGSDNESPQPIFDSEHGAPVAAYRKSDGSVEVKNYHPDEKYNESIISWDELTVAAKGATEALNNLPSSVQALSENLSTLPTPQSYEPINALENSGSQEVTAQLSGLNQTLRDFVSQQGNPTSTQTPVSVNPTVQINEAHAWDYEHIQALADKVSDVIKPAVLSSVGGDSNSY